MTVPTSPTPIIEVQQSFADLLSLEEHAREIIIAPLRRLRVNPIINFSSYRKWMLVFYDIADPTSYFLSKIFASDGRLQRKSKEPPSLLIAIFLFLLIVMVNSTLTSILYETAWETIITYSGVTPPDKNLTTPWNFLFWLVMVSAQVINWCRFILNKKFFGPWLLVIGIFLGFVRLLPLIDDSSLWVMQVFSLDVLDQYRLDYIFFLLQVFAVLSFLFWLFVKTGIWSIVLVLYMFYTIAQLAKTGISEEVKKLLQPVQLMEGRVFSLDGLQPDQLRSAQEWTKTRIEAINYRFVSIGAFLALFTLFTTSSTAQGWVDQVVNLLKKFLVQQEGMKFGEQFLALTLMLLIIGFVALFYNYWHGILALNLIREACILVQFNNLPAPQPQPEPATDGTSQPWFNVSLIFLLTSLVFLFTSIIKDRRSK